MKTMYWHRKFISRYIIIFLSIFMIVSLYVVEKNLVIETNGYTQKLSAAKLANNAFLLTKDFFLSKGYLCKAIEDLSCTGLVGLSMTEITTDSGNLYAKRSSVNPNMAAIFVKWLTELHLKEGDKVALQATGSYPALNIAMLAAIKILKLKPLIIFSAGSSQFGANRLYFTWPDIYNNLVNKGIFNYKVLGITLGGSHDNGYGMTKEAISYLSNAIIRNGYNLIHIPCNDATNISIKTRMKLYKRNVEINDKIKAYINIGGNMASIGLKRLNIKLLNINNIQYYKDNRNKINNNMIKLSSFPSGVVNSLPPEYKIVNSVAVNFLKDGVPVINVRDINLSIIKKYNMIYNPNDIIPPGHSSIFMQKKYNTILASTLLIVDISLVVFVSIISKKILISFKIK